MSMSKWIGRSFLYCFCSPPLMAPLGEGIGARSYVFSGRKFNATPLMQ